MTWFQLFYSNNPCVSKYTGDHCDPRLSCASHSSISLVTEFRIGDTQRVSILESLDYDLALG